MADIDWRHLPPLSTLRAFEATARLGGYSAAARALNVTPAAISQQVRKLEADVGAALVRRDGRGLALTDAGHKLAQPLSEAFALIEKGVLDLRRGEENRGVHVSTTDRFVDAAILPHLGTFWQQHPKTQVSFSPDGNTRPVDLEVFDIVIRAAAPGHQWDGYYSVPLIESQIIVCASPSLADARSPSLAGLPWIQDYSIGGDVFNAVVAQTGNHPNAIEIIDPGGAKFELEAALLGYGLHISPELTVRKFLREGTLVQVHNATGWTGVYHAICRKGPLSRPVQLFLNWLVVQCGELQENPPRAGR